MPALRRFVAPCAALLVAALTARADVVVHTLDEEAPLRGISLAGDDTRLTLHSAEGRVLEIPTTRVVEILSAPEPVAPPPSARPFEVELVDGCLLRGLLDGGSAGELRLRSPALRDNADHVDVPMEAVAAVRRVPEDARRGSSRLVRVPGRDAAYTVEGARVEGFVAAFGATGLTMDRGDLGTRAVGYDELAALFLDNDAAETGEGLQLIARLSDGSQAVLGAGFRIAGGTLTGTTPCGLALRVSMAQVAALGTRGGSFVHLSDLTPAHVEREPFFPLPEGPASEAMLDFLCPVRPDTSPDGNPITLRGHRFFKGIGVRPTTALTFAVGGRYREFRALCGIDDEVLGPGYGRGTGRGSVIFAVRVDGALRFESKPVLAGEDPVEVRVDVAQARELTLSVSLVPAAKMPRGKPDSPELDNAVWARPILVR